MSEEIASCPFCQKQPNVVEKCGQVYLEGIVFKVAVCETEDCAIEGIEIYVEAWNQRADNWISVEDRLPTIPQGKFAVCVLAVQFDPVFEELCPGRGQSVSRISYDKEGFKVLYIGGDEGSGYMPPGDEVTHWQYLPEPPTNRKQATQNPHQRPGMM